jgi:RNA polymerase sigma factor (sigma-70 family)
MSGTERKDGVRSAQNPAANLAAGTFREYGRDLHRFLRKRLRDPANADDVVQEVFARLTRVKRPELVKKPKSYLFGIAFHVIQEIELHEGPVTFDSDVANQAGERLPEGSQEDLADRLNLQGQLERALAELPEIERVIVLMCKRDGMTYEEAAKQTGISTHMVEKHLIAARAKLMAMAWDR